MPRNDVIMRNLWIELTFSLNSRITDSHLSAWLFHQLQKLTSSPLFSLNDSSYLAQHSNFIVVAAHSKKVHPYIILDFFFTRRRSVHHNHEVNHIKVFTPCLLRPTQTNSFIQRLLLMLKRTFEGEKDWFGLIDEFDCGRLLCNVDLINFNFTN